MFVDVVFIFPIMGRNKILFNIFNSKKDKLRIENINKLEEEIKDLKLKIVSIGSKIEKDKHDKNIVDYFYSDETIYKGRYFGYSSYKYLFNLMKDGSIELNEGLKDNTIKTTIIQKEDVKLLLTLLDCNREILGE